MEPMDIGRIFVIYNLIIGVLLVLASDKIASGVRRLGGKAQRFSKISVFTFGSCVTALSSWLLILHLMS